jgi:tetratricopeptide (TPR) repeat protein
LAEAIEIYERAVREHPDDAFLLHNLGLALERSGDDEQAGHAYERALAAQDPPAEAHANFARLLQRRRDYPAAARQFELYLAQTMDAPAEIHWALAVCQHRQGNLPAAEGNYRKALERAPEHADIKHGLATALVELGQGGEAVRLLAELRKTDPSRRVLPALAFARQLICDWTDWDAALAELKSHLAKVDDAGGRNGRRADSTLLARAAAVASGTAGSRAATCERMDRRERIRNRALQPSLVQRTLLPNRRHSRMPLRKWAGGCGSATCRRISVRTRLRIS